MKKLVIPTLILILVMATFIVQQKQGNPAQAQETEPEVQTLEGKVSSMGEATRIVVPMTDKPPVHTAEEILRLERLADETRLIVPDLPIGTTAVQRADSVLEPETATQIADAVEFNPKAGINAPGDMVTFRNTVVPSASLEDMTAVAGSPSTANNGYVVVETGNWYAAFSGDGGKHFMYVDPVTAFPASYGGFCCNQVIIYVPSRDMFVWELEYANSTTEGGALRIAIARGNEILEGIWYYTDLEAAPGYFYNFADLTLSNDFLYITTNGFTSAGSWTDSFMFRWPLDPLLAGEDFTYIFFDPHHFGLRAVHGATETIYWAAHNSTSQVGLYSLEEDSDTVYFTNINLSNVWYDNARVCPGPDGKNWCGGVGIAGRILTGWVSRGMIGFMWGSSQGGSFVYPYVESALINEADKSYAGRITIWNPNHAFIYPGASVNARGDLAFVMNYGGGSYYPRVGYQVRDDFLGSSNVYTVGISTQGPNTNNWGRYNTVRPFAPTNLVWGGAGFVLNGCGDNGCVDPIYFIFGRERDVRSLMRYWEPRYGAFMPIIKR